MGRKVRTNVVVDESLVERVMDLYDLKSRREAIDFALRAVAGGDETADRWKGALELEGMWADMSDEDAREIYGDRIT